MGYTMHKEITTKLTIKEVAYIVSAITVYLNGAGKDGDSEVNSTMRKLVDRLHNELDAGEPWEA